MNKGTGLVILEVRNSNPNGDPDREGEPRTRNDGIGEITSVSFKRKHRDLIGFKEGPVWIDLAEEMKLDPKKFDIFEERGRDRDVIKKMTTEELLAKYWDARIYGCTFLEEGCNHVKSGAIQIGIGESVAPVELRLMTLTNKSGTQDGKDRGMAPLGLKVVQHGVYCIPFHVNPTIAARTHCTAEDIELALKVMPHSYSHTASAFRSDVFVRHVWYAEHKTPVGSCPPHKILDALRPTKEIPKQPSVTYTEYDVPQVLPKELRDKLASFKDYVA